MVSVFSELYELFEREFLSDLLALTNTAKRISGNNGILINFNQESTFAFTDGNFIFLPKKFRDKIKPAQGLVAHESGHIGYGSYEISFMKLVNTISTKYKFPSFIVKKIINVIEDVRINALNNIKFPGFYKNLRDLTYNLLPELKLRMKKYGDLLVYINLFMENYEEFQIKPKFKTKVMSDDDWNAISLAKTFLLKTLTPVASIITIDQVCKVLKRYFIKKSLIGNSRLTEKATEEAYRKIISGEGFDAETFYENTEFSPEIQPQDDLCDEQDITVMEDPYFCDEEESHGHQGFNQEGYEPLLNHFDDFTSIAEVPDNSKLNKASEDIIDKLKDSELNTEDIERLIEEIDSFRSEHNSISNSETKNINFDMSASEFPDGSDSLKQLIKTELKYEKINNQNDKTELDRLSKTVPELENGLEINSENLEEGNYITEFIKLVTDAHNAMEDRLFVLERGDCIQKLSEGKGERQVIETRIENETMKPIHQSYNEIIETFRNLIAKIKFIFRDFRNQVNLDNFQKKGRLNNKFIKAVTSDFEYNKCFSKKIKQKELKILLLVDISGSMSGDKLIVAKIAMIMLCQALYDIAQLRIVLFTGDYDAINILLKDFNEYPDPRKFDKFGCHGNVCSNLDGISIKHEAARLEKNVLIIVISDGQPAGSGNYGLFDAIKEIHDVKKLFKVFAFSIDAKGDYLDQLYNKNWVLTSSSDKTDLGDKLIKFCKLVIKEFFR